MDQYQHRRAALFAAYRDSTPPPDPPPPWVVVPAADPNAGCVGPFLITGFTLIGLMCAIGLGGKALGWW